MELCQTIYDTIWSEYFWLPPNVTWAHLESRPDIHIARPRELLYTFHIAIGLFILRIIWEK